jgi:hypothetical protein
MSSRKEQREAARKAREEQARAEAAAQKRKKIIGLSVAGVLGVALVAAIVVAIVLGSGGDDNGGGGSADAEPVAITGAVGEAAREAGCVAYEYPDQGRDHVPEGPVDYNSNPPTSGGHRPVPADDGLYDTGNSPETEATVHSLEHGRINIQYREGLPASQIEQLRKVADERDAYHVLFFQNDTDMPYAVAATSWTRLLGCKSFNPKVLNAIRAFRDEYTDAGPEVVP